MRTLFLLVVLLLVAPAAAAPIPRFDSPAALLEGIYADIVASQDWENYDPDSGFDETEAFSARLAALHEQADAIVMADGSEMGALDFSPFINGQDDGGLTFRISAPKIKGSRAVASVDVLLEGRVLHKLGFELVEDGAAGWKVDDIILPGNWRLSAYFADPLAPL
jgi:hypothetical protein